MLALKTFDVQSVGLNRPARDVFEYIANPANLPEWASAFLRADDASADLATPNGMVAIRLETIISQTSGTVDWRMTFPDGMVGWAYSRITPDGDESAVYSFVLMAPPVPLEMLEGTLGQQMKTLENELVCLKARLES